MEHPIKTKREQQNISQNELSRLSGVKQSAISDIESGKTKAPRIDTYAAIARALNCKIDELMKD